MAPLAWPVLVSVFGAAVGFGLVLDQIKLLVIPTFKIA
jgi:hypothetical protein